MTKKKYEVALSTEERNYLLEMLAGDTQRVRKVKRTQILLKADDDWSDPQIAQGISVGLSTVERTRKRYAESGLEAALNDRKRNRGYKRTMDDEAEARLVALVNSQPPEGHHRWTLRLLAVTGKRTGEIGRSAL